ncbi:phosphomannomutase/phosphoglucomutase [Frateuria terrea]|uniref:phosphomannomutase n=1 Tax=Frateuria terrea TaxID=529704 RepID=A0A1H6T1N4_9GAMM|nr:phosphomannomutase/phosphoglucomutase [Frateuria terrea]SEI73978.1 phosphomannomutase / phosphoglucomutase [Frateuria terrea]SFP30101.1 phosphomannomutase / phosphoglucomutase [Frateuria terrea]
MARKIAREPGAGGAVAWQQLLPLAGGTVLLLLGLFCAWQTWLIASESGGVARVHAAQDAAVRSLAAEIAGERKQVAQAAASLDPSMLQGDRAQLAQALRERLPQALGVDVYSAGLDEVLHANYRTFGYAKAAQLMAAQTGEGEPPMQTVVAGGQRRLSLVQPLGSAQRPQGWAWIELPFTPLQQRFESIAPGDGRIDLRQGDDRGELSLLTRGAPSAQAEDIAKPVPGSSFSVRAALPAAFILLPRFWPLAALLALLCIGGGLYLLSLRGRTPVREEIQPEETMVSDVIPAKPQPAPPAARPAASMPPAASPADAVDPSIFRAYDVRGVVGKTLTAQVARLLGQSIGTLMREKGLNEIVVGRDGRLSGPELAGALSDGLREAGIDVIDVGAVPTPVVYFAAYRFNTGSGVAVTGSHNPPDYNGFKIVVGGETLSEGAIQDLYKRIASGALEAGGQGGLRHVDVVPDYIERITSDVQAERRLKVVVDCGNGIPGAVAPQVLEGIGCEIVPLYCEVDGTFPNHHPDPSDPHNLEDLIHAVRQTGADLGVAFDGDGDRLGVVTREGEIIYPDRLLMLFARDVLSRQPGATIIYDVKCTGHLKGQVLEAGGSPLMWRTGHSLIKAKMRQTQAELAGEMSGHFFFKERWYGFDDGIYAGARLLEILASDLDARTPEQIFATCPKGVSTPELKIELAEGEHYRFIEKFKEKAGFGDATLTTIDGVRADWPDGWGLVRASNTTPVLVLRFDADNAAALKRIQQAFREQLFLVDPGLKLPF